MFSSKRGGAERAEESAEFLRPLKTWSGTLHGRPGARCSSYKEEVSRKVRDTAGGTPALPIEESALLGRIAHPKRTFGTKVPAYEEAAFSISAF